MTHPLAYFIGLLVIPLSALGITFGGMWLWTRHTAKRVIAAAVAALTEEKA